MFRFPLWTLAFLFTLALFPAVSDSAIIHVSKDGDGSDGTSWDKAFQTLTAGLAVAASGDQIWVKGGVYHERIQLATDVAVYGGFAGTEGTDEFDLRDWKTNETVVDGDGDHKRLFKSAAGAVLDGLIFRDGLAGGGLITHSMELSNCDIEDNSGVGEGAGLYIEAPYVRLTMCNIAKNRAAYRGGGIFAFCDEMHLDKCLISNNECYDTGGGLLNAAHVRDMTNCIVSNNTCEIGSGGGMYAIQSIAKINHCAFVRSSSAQGGESIDVHFSGNANDPLSSITILNSIITDSRRGIFYHIHNSVLATPLHFGEYGSGNIVANPLFIGPDDYHLQANSPAIDAGTKVNVFGDLDGNPRPIDIPGHGQDGTQSEFDCGAYEFQIPAATPTPTMSPQPTATMNPNSDINENGRVDAEVLMMLLEDWGKRGGR
jgi:hypothetical protein